MRGLTTTSAYFSLGLLVVTAAMKAVECAAIALGRPAGTSFARTLSGGDFFLWRRWDQHRSEVFEQRGGFGWWTAADTCCCNLQHPHSLMRRHGQHVAYFYDEAGLPDVLTIEPDLTGENEICRLRA